MNRTATLELAAVARRFAELLEASVGDPAVTSDRELSVADVAARLGRSASTVRGWLEMGELKGYKLPGDPKRAAWRVTVEALAAFRNRKTTDVRAWRKERGKAA